MPKREAFKFNIANGNRAPNYAQVFAFVRYEGTYRFEVDDNSLNMEKSLEAELGVVVDKQDWTISITDYNNMVNDYVFIQPTQDSVKQLRIYRSTQHDAIIRGLAIDLHWHPANIDWTEGFVAQVSRAKLTDDAGDLPHIPATNLVAGISFKKQAIGHWLNPYVSLHESVFGSQEHISNYETESYALTDLFIGAVAPFGRNDRRTLTAFCTNLFNKTYFNHLSLIKTMGVREFRRNIGLQVR